MSIQTELLYCASQDTGFFFKCKKPSYFPTCCDTEILNKVHSMGGYIWLTVTLFQHKILRKNTSYTHSPTSERLLLISYAALEASPRSLCNPGRVPFVSTHISCTKIYTKRFYLDKGSWIMVGTSQKFDLWLVTSPGRILQL